MSYNKTLKLSNVLIFEIKLNEETNIDREITQMENFIKSSIKTACSDINETANGVDDHIEDFIKNVGEA